MWNSNAVDDDRADGVVGSDASLPRYSVAAAVSDDVIEAVEGWRRAHGFTEQSEALGELVRLGLMSEVAKIYRLVCRDGIEAEPSANVLRKQRRHHRSKRG